MARSASGRVSGRDQIPEGVKSGLGKVVPREPVPSIDLAGSAHARLAGHVGGFEKDGDGVLLLLAANIVRGRHEGRVREVERGFFSKLAPGTFLPALEQLEVSPRKSPGAGAVPTPPSAKEHLALPDEDDADADARGTALLGAHAERDAESGRGPTIACALH